MGVVNPSALPAVNRFRMLANDDPAAYCRRGARYGRRGKMTYAFDDNGAKKLCCFMAYGGFPTAADPPAPAAEERAGLWPATLQIKRIPGKTETAARPQGRRAAK